MSLKSSISGFFKIEELRDNILKLAESKFELKKLELLGKVEKLLGKIIMNAMIALFVFMIFLLLNILIASIINHYSASFWIGYACLIGFYSLLYLIFHFSKEKVAGVIESKIADMMIEEKF